MKTLKIEELSKNFGSTEVLKKINLSREIAAFAKVIYVIKDSRSSCDFIEFPEKLITFYLFNLCAIQTSIVGKNLKFE